MPAPATVTFGPWSPDIQNDPVEVAPGFGAQTMPCADCLNVYFQDGNYKLIPSPNLTGPTLGAPALNAFTWFDDVAGQEIVFAGTANGLDELIDGVWSVVPLSISASVAVNGIRIGITQGGLVQAAPVGLAISLGTVTIGGGQLINAVLVGGPASNGYLSGSFGSLTPSADIRGNVISEFDIVSSHGIQFTRLTYNTAALGASYFSSVVCNGTTLTSGTASYSTSGGVSQWTWTPVPTFPPGTGVSFVINP